MSKQESVDEYLRLVEREGLWSSRRNFLFYMGYIFNNVRFEDRGMLDVGGGGGLLSFYAAAMGARRVVCLEPEGAGAGRGAGDTFERLQSSLWFSDRVRLEPARVQDFDPGGERFDIILLHNSINHLDEEACINLQRDGNAVEIYKGIFRKLSDLAKTGARLIITDCSRYNLFALLHLKNPLAPGIEWHKHQSPKLWAELACDTGFRDPVIRWTSFNRLRSPGRVLFGNKVASFFLASHFCLTMGKR